LGFATCVGNKPWACQVYSGERWSKRVQSTSNNTGMGSTYQAHVQRLLTAALDSCDAQLSCLLRRDGNAWRAAWW